MEDAEARIQQFTLLKDIITDKVVRARQILEEAASMIRHHARTDERPDSLLTKPEQDYIACLLISQDSLDGLLRDDANVWVADLDQK